jgi:Ser-tRNA(Ala) deacylase AlaX
MENNLIPPTEKVYLTDSYLYELENTKLIAIEDWPKEENFICLIFDKTVFHPQGGGQPADQGRLENKEKDLFLNVDFVSYCRDRDIALHKVSKESFINNKILIGDIFHQKINSENRHLYARLHSGGHLLDISVTKLNLELFPGKGYHFPDGPYVEYNGKLDKSQADSLIEKMNKITNDIIIDSKNEDSVISKFWEYEEGKKEFKNIPNYLPEGKPFRWVKLQENDSGCPCGGTHVKHIKDIGIMKITKITIKKNLVRISYNILNNLI